MLSTVIETVRAENFIAGRFVNARCSPMVFDDYSFLLAATVVTLLALVLGRILHNRLTRSKEGNSRLTPIYPFLG